MNSLLSSCRLRALVPLARSLSTRVRPIQEPRDSISTPDAFLKAIGRSSDTKLSVESWEDLWNQDGTKLKSAGVGVRDRRYILWCMEKYRSGLSPEEFAYEPKPKKTIRGWGPSVQNGKRIRSRRDRTKRSKSS
ncbi:Protein FYV4, mitochondrial [Mycena venus]|uniref:Small ribosomal subunit protein mS41 n=1 Tax=Mycena venus TaxID=2733690 RepID=A0A8H6YUI1_9AGAR|nr:Protein FYV4, mitochondrial [Mycena venus]